MDLSLSKTIRIVVGVVGGVLLGGLLWVIGGGQIVERLENRFWQRFSEPWVTFTVPSRYISANADVELMGDIIKVCNRGPGDWAEGLVQIDGGYVRVIGTLPHDRCVNLPITSFASPDFKKLPAPTESRIIQ